MEPERDRRFDLTSAVQMLLAIEHERSLSGLFDKLVARAVACSDIAFVQILLIETDGLLHAAGAGGRGPHQTFAPPPGAGEGPIGGVAATGKRLGLRPGDPGWRELADAAWAENEGIRAFGELVGESGARRQITGQIDLVAPTEASVLIFDESGTGKERVARQIHRRSKRAGGPRCA